ncbi:MAG: tetratricopeptide repeat protein [Planctomycetia bacterium]|nr:tetratricopeptide repeat protein [Planctomycetia bacterium]
MSTLTMSKSRAENVLAPRPVVDVRHAILEADPFGPEQVKQLRFAIAGPQVSDVRQALAELFNNVADGDANKRNHIALGITCYLMARHPHAAEHLVKVNGDATASFYLAQALVSLGRFDEAAVKFEQSASLGWDNVDSTLFRAGAIRQAGRLDEAETIVRSTARAGATRAEYSYQMGCILAERSDTFGAIEYFERAVDMDPHHTGALFRLANLNNQLGNDDDAIKLYERALSRPPFFLGALINLGLMYEDQEMFAPAAFCFRRALEFDPTNQRARLYLNDVEAVGDMFFDEDTVRRNRELETVLLVPIADFELSARSRNCLDRAGIHSLGDLTRITEAELLSNKNFGETSLKEVREMMESRALTVGQSLTMGKPAAVLSHAREDVAPEVRAKLEMTVADLNLTVRSRKCLSRLGITTVGELVAKSADELLTVRNFGVTSLNEIRAKLTDVSMALRND